MNQCNALAQQRWNQLCHEQGWSEASQVQILEDFVGLHGLWPMLADHAAERARDENCAG